MRVWTSILVFKIFPENSELSDFNRVFGEVNSEFVYCLNFPGKFRIKSNDDVEHYLFFFFDCVEHYMPL